MGGGEAEERKELSAEEGEEGTLEMDQGGGAKGEEEERGGAEDPVGEGDLRQGPGRSA